MQTGSKKLQQITSTLPAGIIRGAEIETHQLVGGLGVRFLVDGADTGGDYAIVEHPIAPRALAAETHTHEREDEISFVIEGRVGVRLDGEDLVAGPGDVIVKPRGIPHAFWNAGDEPARILELIAPAGFEDFFREIIPLARAVRDDPERLAEFAPICDRYGLSFEEGAREELCARHGLSL